jgi:transcriptional regulator with XRE-family HTH domain
MSFGETLRNARLQKKMSTSDVAEATHMMVQIVEDLEREDFRRIAAPIYGRGFVKLYAELLSLDPVPLTRDFMDLYSGAKAPSVRTKRLETAEPAVERPLRASAAPAAENGSAASAAPAAPSVPQRQTVQAKPLVRQLSTPPSAAPRSEAPAKNTVSASGAVSAPAVAPRAPEKAPVTPRQASPSPVSEKVPLAVSRAAEPRDAVAPADKAAPAPRAEDAETLLAGEARKPGLVVESEEPFAESDEPDLFHPQPIRRKSSAEDGDDLLDEGAHRPPAKKRKYPVFQVGGRTESGESPSQTKSVVQVASEYYKAIEKLAADLVKPLRRTLERKLPLAMWPRRQVLALGGIGLALFVFVIVGIGVLFKATNNVKAKPSNLIETVAPPPSMYVD